MSQGRAAGEIDPRWYRDLLETAPDATVLIDSEGSIRLVNAQTERMFGYPRSELLGRRVEILIPDRYAHKHTVQRDSYFGEPRVREMGAGIELWGKRRDGTEFPLEISLSPLRTDEGVFATASIRDITDRKRAQDQFRALLESAPDAMIIINDRGLIQLVNAQTERLFGYQREALVGKTVEILIPERLRARHQGRREGYFHAPKVREMGAGLELWGRKKDGSEFPIEISLSPMQTENGQWATAAVRDVSERKRTDQELRAARDAAVRAMEKIQQANRVKSEFLANMSHELRTPLNAIIGFSELLESGAVTGDMLEHDEFVRDILASGRHLLQLINDVLDLSKVETGKMQFRPEHVTLDTVVTEVLNVLRTTAAAKEITVTSAIAPDVAHAFLDASRFKQVLYNFVSNALKFTPSGGRVSIRVLADPDHKDCFRLEVEDTGIGIKEEDFGRLFVAFEQIDSSSTRQQGGAGLGLAVTRLIVEAQGGSVGLQSTLGRGSTFFATLPRHVGNGLPLPPPRTFRVADASAARVLVIEDNEKDQALIVKAFNDAGYNVETAANGAQAIAKCRERAFDGVTIDLLLPDMTGTEVLQEIRGTPLNRNIPAIVATVVAAQGAVAGFAVHDLLMKPIDTVKLVLSLQRAGVVAGRPGRVLVVDDDERACKLMAATLAQANYQVDCCERGASALALARASPPGAVVLDLTMPEMDGFQFLEQLRCIEGCVSLPVIVWTSRDLTEKEMSRLSVGAQSIVIKGARGATAVVEQIAALVPRKEAVDAQ
jgi:PAS domain S-box-containing protein